MEAIFFHKQGLSSQIHGILFNFPKTNLFEQILNNNDENRYHKHKKIKINNKIKKNQSF